MGAGTNNIRESTSTARNMGADSTDARNTVRQETNIITSIIIIHVIHPLITPRP